MLKAVASSSADALGITSLTGDVTATGPGAAAATLASSISGAKAFTTSMVVGGATAQFVSGGTGSIAPFSIPAIFSTTGTIAAYSTTAEHMLSNNWTEQNVLSIWSQHDSGYSAINFLSSGKGAEFAAFGYGNHTTGSNVFSRRAFIEAAGYGLGGGVVTFTNGSANIAVASNNFEVGQAVVFTVSGGTLPTNFTANGVVYVIATSLSSTNFQVANTPGGSAVVAGSAGSGTPSVGTAPASFVIVQTGVMGGVSGSYVRALFRNDGNVYLGGVDANDTPAVIIPRTGGIALADTNTRMRLFNANLLFESYTTASSGFAFANNSGSNTVFMFPTANGTWQFGGPNAGTTVAQTFAMQNGSGNNAVGANFTVVGSLATGNVNSGDIIFQTGGAVGASGNTLATAGTALTIKGVTGAVTIASGKSLVLGNAATTGLTAGVLAALTNATIVITDSTGQAYRIPCII